MTCIYSVYPDSVFIHYVFETTRWTISWYKQYYNITSLSLGFTILEVYTISFS